MEEGVGNTETSMKLRRKDKRLSEGKVPSRNGFQSKYKGYLLPSFDRHIPLLPLSPSSYLVFEPRPSQCCCLTNIPLYHSVSLSSFPVSNPNRQGTQQTEALQRKRVAQQKSPCPFITNHLQKPKLHVRPTPPSGLVIFVSR